MHILNNNSKVCSLNLDILSLKYLKLKKNKKKRSFYSVGIVLILTSRPFILLLWKFLMAIEIALYTSTKVTRYLFEAICRPKE